MEHAVFDFEIDANQWNRTDFHIHSTGQRFDNNHN